MSDISSVPPEAREESQALGRLNELRIEILPHLAVNYEGTQAQLVSDGLIAKGFKWPRGAERLYWESEGMRYALYRVRPDDHKGRVRCWDEVDKWCLSVQLSARLGDTGRGDRRRLEKMAADLAAERYRLSAEGQREYAERWRRYIRIREDKAFQRFKALVPGLVPPKRTRRPRVNEVAGINQGGASHV